jgi:hypothetical protein
MERPQHNTHTRSQVQAAVAFTKASPFVDHPGQPSLLLHASTSQPHNRIALTPFWWPYPRSEPLRYKPQPPPPGGPPGPAALMPSPSPLSSTATAASSSRSSPGPAHGGAPHDRARRDRAITPAREAGTRESRALHLRQHIVSANPRAASGGGISPRGRFSCANVFVTDSFGEEGDCEAPECPGDSPTGGLEAELCQEYSFFGRMNRSELPRCQPSPDPHGPPLPTTL